MSRTERRLDEKLGLCRVEAADYIGVGVTLFDAMVDDGRMPQPKEINSRMVWERPALDEAFRALPNRICKGSEGVEAAKPNPWDRRPATTQAA